eukprot:gene24754-biopygen17939
MPVFTTKTPTATAVGRSSIPVLVSLSRSVCSLPLHGCCVSVQLSYGLLRSFPVLLSSCNGRSHFGAVLCRSTYVPFCSSDPICSVPWCCFVRSVLFIRVLLCSVPALCAVLAPYRRVPVLRCSLPVPAGFPTRFPCFIPCPSMLQLCSTPFLFRYAPPFRYVLRRDGRRILRWQGRCD